MFKNISFMFLVVVVAPIATFADEMEQWYGTISVEKVLHQDSREEFKRGHSYYPGYETKMTDEKFSGTIRFLPGDQKVISGKYRRHVLRDRRTDRTENCTGTDRQAEYHDYEQQDYLTSDSAMQTSEEGLRIYIGDEGDYEISAELELPASKDNQRGRTMREFFHGCRPKPLDRKSEDTKLTTILPPLMVTAEAKAEILPPPTLSGEQMVPDLSGALVKVKWDLVRKAPGLVAMIKGPAEIIRGETVTLNGLSSKGKITEYGWEFASGEDCGDFVIDPEFKMNGSTVRFQVVCSFEATLTVKNEGGSEATDRFQAQIKAREGEPWKTHFNRETGDPLEEKMVLEHMHIGVNQCVKHDADTTSGHIIHTKEKNNATWMDTAYRAAEVTDSGPFFGAWFVTTPEFEIDRVERVNANLLAPLGQIYELNQTHKNEKAVKKLFDQVSAHEKVHSDLMDELLQRLGTDGDPATRVEATVASNKTLLQTLADMRVREVETQLKDATSEKNVANRLRARSAFQQKISVWFPTLSGGEYQKDMGPLWGIGD